MTPVCVYGLVLSFMNWSAKLRRQGQSKDENQDGLIGYRNTCLLSKIFVSEISAKKRKKNKFRRLGTRCTISDLI